MDFLTYSILLGTIKESSNKKLNKSIVTYDYSSAQSYSVGNYCFYSDKLYKCNTAIPSPGEQWNASHWTETTIGNELIYIMMKINEHEQRIEALEE